MGAQSEEVTWTQSVRATAPARRSIERKSAIGRLGSPRMKKKRERGNRNERGNLSIGKTRDSSFLRGLHPMLALGARGSEDF